MRRVGVFFMLVIFIIGTSIAQDVPTIDQTAEADPATLESTLTPTPTWTSEPTLTSTVSETSTVTPLEVSTLTETPTASAQAPTETSSATESLNIILTPTATLVAEPPVSTLISDAFETVDRDSILWTFGSGWAYHTLSGGQSLRVYNSDASVTWNGGPLADVAAEAQFVVDYGTAFLSVRQSEVGVYTVSLDKTGLVTLLRGSEIKSQAQTLASAPDQWRTVRLSAVGTIVRVSVDGFPLLNYDDPAALPAGQVSFHAGFTPLSDGTPMPPENTVLVDNIVISAPTGEVLPTATVTQTASMTPSLTASVTASLTSEAPVDVEASAPLSAMSLQSTSECDTSEPVERILEKYGEIYSIDLETVPTSLPGGGIYHQTSCFRRLTPYEIDQSYENDWPTGSPDGYHIAFVSPKAGDAAVYIMDANGTHMRRVTGGDFSPAEISHISWSPESDQLAFIALMPNETEDDAHLYVVNEDGTGLTQIQAGIGLTSAMWSPVSDTIAITEANGTISLINADGSGSTSISIEDPDQTNPNSPSLKPVSIFWSADGNQFYFTAERLLPCHTQINRVPDCPYNNIFSVATSGGTATNLSGVPDHYTDTYNEQYGTRLPTLEIIFEDTIVDLTSDGRILFRSQGYDYESGEDLDPRYYSGYFLMSASDGLREMHSRTTSTYYDVQRLVQGPDYYCEGCSHKYNAGSDYRIYSVSSYNGGIDEYSAQGQVQFLAPGTILEDNSEDTLKTTLQGVGHMKISDSGKTLAFECTLTITSEIADEDPSNDTRTSTQDVCAADILPNGVAVNPRRLSTTDTLYEHLGNFSEDKIVWIQSPDPDIRSGETSVWITSIYGHETPSELAIPLSYGHRITSAILGADGNIYYAVEGDPLSSGYEGGIYQTYWIGGNQVTAPQLLTTDEIFPYYSRDTFPTTMTSAEFKLNLNGAFENLGTYGLGLLYEVQVIYSNGSVNEKHYQIGILDTVYGSRNIAFEREDAGVSGPFLDEAIERYQPLVPEPGYIVITNYYGLTARALNEWWQVLPIQFPTSYYGGFNIDLAWTTGTDFYSPTPTPFPSPVGYSFSPDEVFYFTDTDGIVRSDGYYTNPFITLGEEMDDSNILDAIGNLQVSYDGRYISFECAIMGGEPNYWDICVSQILRDGSPGPVHRYTQTPSLVEYLGAWGSRDNRIVWIEADGTDLHNLSVSRTVKIGDMNGAIPQALNFGIPYGHVITDIAWSEGDDFYLAVEGNPSAGYSGGIYRQSVSSVGQPGVYPMPYALSGNIPSFDGAQPQYSRINFWIDDVNGSDEVLYEVFSEFTQGFGSPQTYYRLGSTRSVQSSPEDSFFKEHDYTIVEQQNPTLEIANQYTGTLAGDYVYLYDVINGQSFHYSTMALLLHQLGTVFLDIPPLNAGEGEGLRSSGLNRERFDSRQVEEETPTLTPTQRVMTADQLLAIEQDYSCAATASYSTISIRYSPVIPEDDEDRNKTGYQLPENFEVRGHTPSDWYLVIVDYGDDDPINDIIGWSYNINHGGIWPSSSCDKTKIKPYPDDVDPFPTPTPYPTKTPGPTKTPSATPVPGDCEALPRMDTGLYFRLPETDGHGWVAYPDGYKTNIKYEISPIGAVADTINDPRFNGQYVNELVAWENNGATLVAEEWQNNNPAGILYPVQSLQVDALVGIHPVAAQTPQIYKSGNVELDQRYTWLDLTLVIINAQGQPITTMGSMALHGYVPQGEPTYYLSLEGDCAEFLPSTEGQPEPQDPTRVTSCYTYGLPSVGIDLTPSTIRDATGKGRVWSIDVNRAVYYFGNEADPVIQSWIANGLIEAAPVIPPGSNVPPEAIAEGYALIYFDDTTPLSTTPPKRNPDASRTSDRWWILASMLEAYSEDPVVFQSNVGCPQAEMHDAAPVAEPQFGAVFQTLIDQSGSMFGENIPPAIMGQGGLHVPVGANSYTLDTVPINAEKCIDKGDCSDLTLYDPSMPIPLYAPFPGCLLTPQTPGLEDDMAKYPQVIELVYNTSPRECKSAKYSNPRLNIHFTHVDTLEVYVPDGSLLPPIQGFVNEGDLIGYLCPLHPVSAVNGDDPCKLGKILDTGSELVATHLATTITASSAPASLFADGFLHTYVYIQKTEDPNDDEGTDQLIGVFFNLHDCTPKDIIKGGLPVNANPVPNMCSQFGY